MADIFHINGGGYEWSIRHLGEVANFSNLVIDELKAFCLPWQKARIFNQN